MCAFQPACKALALHCPWKIEVLWRSPQGVKRSSSDAEGASSEKNRFAAARSTFFKRFFDCDLVFIYKNHIALNWRGNYFLKH